MSKRTETPTEKALIAEFQTFNALDPSKKIPVRRMIDVLRRLSFAYGREKQDKADLLEAAKTMLEFYDELIAAPEFTAERERFVEPLRAAIAKATP